MKKIEVSNPTKVVIVPHPPVSGSQKPTSETKNEEVPAEEPEEGDQRKDTVEGQEEMKKTE